MRWRPNIRIQPPATLEEALRATADHMSWLAEYLETALDLLKDFAPYMVLGFLVAEVVEKFVSEKRLLRYFGENS